MKKNKLTMRSCVRTLSIKVYDEQMPAGWADVCQKMQACDKDEMHVIGIRHDRDTTTDEWWEPATVKPHYHIIVRMLNKKVTRVETVLNGLGIVFRHPEDDILWSHHGVETIRNFPNMAMYLTHETEQAELDGKERYQLAELAGNLGTEELKQVRQGYTRLQIGKVSTKEMEELDKVAWELGRNLKDFDLWFNALPYAVRSNSKASMLRQTYNQGIEETANERAELNRLCVFIHGNANSGKSYNTVTALKNMGLKVYSVDGGGTGKYDRLKVSHEALVLDDNCSENLLKLADNYICQVYRRGSNNPYWCGKIFVVTSNFTFEEWLQRCGVEALHFDAMRSRFYRCEVAKNSEGVFEMKCKGVSKRGTPADQLERKELFQRFQLEYNESSKNYKEEYAVAVDYSDILT